MKFQINDPAYLLNQQYSDASNLEARIALHRDHTINEPEPWYRWVGAQLDWQSDEQLLVCGGGPGKLWQANLDHAPAGGSMVFTDMSPGMVEAAKDALQTAAFPIEFAVADVSDLQFSDDSFDRVTANHMLYHVPDIAGAIAEIRRVLRPGGRLIAATNGAGHMAELREIGRILAPGSYWETRPDDLPFSLQNGASFLQPHFDSVELRMHQGSIAVDNFEALFGYLTSYGDARTHATEATLLAAAEQFNTQLDENGLFHIQKATGVFIAR